MQIEPTAQDGRRRIKILCVGGDMTPYGAPRVQLNLLANLDRNTFEPNIYFLRNELDKNEKTSLVLDAKYGVEKPQRALYHLPKLLWQIISHARKSDIIFSMLEGPPLYLAAIASKVTGRPLISWVHNNWSAVLCHSKPWHKPLSRLFFPMASRTICVSEGVRNELVEIYPELKESCQTIPNPVLIDQVRVSSTNGVPKWSESIFSKPTILAAGRLVHQKGFDLLIKSAALACARGADFNLLILGGGNDQRPLLDLASELGIKDRVFIPGYVVNPFPLFRRARLFVLSSRYEGLPTVLLEALALGVPIVSFDCKFGPAEILNEEQGAILVTAEDTSALADALYAAICDPEWNGKMTGTCRSDMSKYSAENTVSAFQNAFEELLGTN